MNSLFNIKLVDLIKVSIVIVILSFVASCTKTEDDEPVIDDREKFIGTWNCSEKIADDAPTNFIVKISYHTNSSQINLNNFYLSGTDINIYAIVTGTKITLPKQNICEGKDIESGSGTYENNKINFTYRVKDGVDYFNCTAVFTKTS